MHYQQPTKSLPHVTDLATCDKMLLMTETGLETLIARRDKVDPADYQSFYREYHRLLRDLRIRRAELTA